MSETKTYTFIHPMVSLQIDVKCDEVLISDTHFICMKRSDEVAVFPKTYAMIQLDVI